MSRSGPAGLPILALAGLLTVSAVFAGEETTRPLLFSEDFTGELSLRWIPFTRPGPRITASRGNPPPALDLAGSGRSRSGLLSKRRFNLGAGLVARADIFVSRAGSTDVCGGSLGFPRDPGDFSRGRWPEWLVGMSYEYIGDTDWSRGAIPEGGTLTCSLIDEDGRLEMIRRPYLNRWLGGWHTFEITIKAGGFVEFRVDGDLVYYSRKRLATDTPHLPLLLGHLSGRGGKVYLDNVKVRAGRPSPGPAPVRGE